MRNKRNIRKDLKNKILLYFSNNIREYAIILIIFLIGVILGTLYVRNMKENEYTEINSYITDFLDMVNNGSKVNSNGLFQTSLRNNLIIVFLLGLAGLTVIGMPILYIIIAFKGFSIGYTISAIIGTVGRFKGFKFIISSLFLQNIIIIPCIIVLSVSGIKLYKSIIKDRRRENIKVEIIKYLSILFMISVLNIIAAFIESYISANIFIWLYNL